MKLEKTVVNSGVPVYSAVHETAQGGFSLSDNAIADNTELKAGTVIGFNESTRKAKVCKVAVAQANAANNATSYRVLKGHTLTVGKNIKSGSSNAQAITGINTSNANYDEISVGTTLGVAVTTGDAIFIDDEGYTGTKGLLYEDTTVKGETSVGVVLRGTVYERRINPVPNSLKSSLTHIIFSQSF